MSPIGAIASLSTGTYTVTRRAVGAYSDGRWTPGGTSSFSIIASIQPVSGRLLLALPENERTEEQRVVYTITELRTRIGAADPDVVTIDGDAWEVSRVDRWQAFGAVHYRAFVARQAVT
jgi:hypothetical protein